MKKKSLRFVPRVSFYRFRQTIRNPGLTLYNFAIGFYLNPNAIGDWSTGKSTCEGMGMQLASLKSSALNAAAITYITVQQTFGQETSTFQSSCFMIYLSYLCIRYRNYHQQLNEYFFLTYQYSFENDFYQCTIHHTDLFFHHLIYFHNFSSVYHVHIFNDVNL